MPYVVPSRIQSWLQLLSRRYANSEPNLAEILNGSKVFVAVGVDHDNWDGGQDGHDLTVFCPMDLLAEIDSKTASRFEDLLREDLAAECRATRGEYIASIHLQVALSSDELDKALPISAIQTVDPDRLSIWRPGFFRVFISHRDIHKGRARELSDALEELGCSCFVAHETIPTNEEWRKTIVNGLRTMEVMLVFLTEDFSKSIWTMQEVGWALGSNVPTVALKLGTADPPGFISHLQAERGQIENLRASASGLFRIMLGLSGKKARMHSALVTAFVASPHFNATIERFDAMSRHVDKLDDHEVERIRAGFKSNSQLHGCIYLANNNNRLLGFLNRVSDRRYEFSRGDIVVSPDGS